MSKIGFFFIVFLQAFFSLSLRAEILQILHTNDLHGHFQGLNDKERRGGYAQLKNVINRFKAKAEKAGVESLVLDAGDFSEGSIEYTANRGFNTFKMMEIMGYDAIALGNHDYLMGPKRLEEILSEVDLPLLAANIIVNPLTPASRKSILTHRLIDKGNLKIAVVGGTTNEIFYKWIFRGNLFSNPIGAINNQAALFHGRADLVIALTHIGLETDQKLAQKSRALDLIVGGHSHTKLENAVMVKNKAGVEVPIVQTGEHGKFLGELIVDVDLEHKNKKSPRVRILSYKLHPIFQDDPQDSEVETYARKTKEDIKRALGDDYLHEVLGESEIPMIVARNNGDYLQTFWTAWMTKAMQDEVKADLAMNSLELFGIEQKPGPITREKIISFYPRYFNVDHKEGWHIYTTEIKGYWLNMMIELAHKAYKPVIFSGLKFELMPDESGKLKAINLNVNGINIEPFRSYKVAMPEGIFLGMISIMPVLDLRLLHNSEDTNVSIVEAIARRVKAVGKIELTQVNADDFSFIPIQSQQKN